MDESAPPPSAQSDDEMAGDDGFAFEVDAEEVYSDVESDVDEDEDDEDELEAAEAAAEAAAAEEAEEAEGLPPGYWQESRTPTTRPVYIVDPARRVLPATLRTYELTQVLGLRAQAIQRDGKTYIEPPEGVTDPLHIAWLEVRAKKCSFVLSRLVGRAGRRVDSPAIYERWNVNELTYYGDSPYPQIDRLAGAT
jgi:DNA-directed RNA polymerase subunit K/omega